MLIQDVIKLECTNLGWPVTCATTFCTVVPNICGSLVLNYASHHPSGIQNFKMATRFLENCWPCVITYQKIGIRS